MYDTGLVFYDSAKYCLQSQFNLSRAGDTQSRNFCQKPRSGSQ